MTRTVSATDARKRWSTFFGQAVHDRWPVLIQRGRNERALLIGSTELELILEQYEFHPEVVFEPDAVAVWLPELALYGRGHSLEDAQGDLVDEVGDYVEEYVADSPLYLRAPNRAGHFPYVLRAFVADAADRLPEILFAEPRVAVEA